MKNKKIHLLLFFTVAFTSFSQQQKIDSLKFALEKNTEREKIETILNLFETDLPRKEALEFLEDGLTIANNIKFDSIYPLLNYTSIAHYFLGDFESAKKYIRLANKSSEKSRKPTVNFATSIMLLGVFNEAQNQIDSAKYFYNQSLKSIENNTSVDAEKTKASILTNLANLDLKMANYEEAIKNYLKASELSRKNNDDEALLIAYTNIAGCYKNLNDFEKSIHYFDQALNISKNTNRNFYTPTIQGALGEVYILNDELDKGINILEAALEDLKRFDFNQHLPTTLHSLSEAYLKKSEYQTALRYAEEGFNLLSNTNDPYKLTDFKITKSAILSELDRFTEADKLLQSAKTIAHTNQYQDLLLLAYKSELALNKKNKNFTKQVEIYDSIIHYNEIVFNIEKNKNIQDLETRYQTQKKENENQKLLIENTENKLQIVRKQRQNQYLMIGGVSLLLVLTLLILYFKTQKNKLINATQFQIIKEKEMEQNRIAELLHDDKSKTLELISIMASKKGQSEIATAINEVKDGLRKVSRELSIIPFDESEFNEQIITLASQYHSENLSINLHGLNDINWPAINETIKRNLFAVFKEAISNTHNHSQAKNLDLYFKIQRNKLHLTIINDGKKFESNEVVYGKGITGMKMKIDQLNGKITFSNLGNKGLKIGIILSIY